VSLIDLKLSWALKVSKKLFKDFTSNIIFWIITYKILAYINLVFMNVTNHNSELHAFIVKQFELLEVPLSKSTIGV